jgi:hypothetical protein
MLLYNLRLEAAKLMTSGKLNKELSTEQVEPSDPLASTCRA